MGTIFKIAVRNLIQHRSKTIIIGVLITLAIALGLVGNTLSDSAQRSLKRTFTENFTGDVLILPKEIQGGIFGAGSDDNSGGPPILPMMKDYEKVFDLVQKKPEVASATSQISSYVLINLQDAGINFGLVFGIEPDDYFKTFDNVVVTQGRRLQPGETGIMIHEKIIDAMKKDNNVEVKIGTNLQLNNFGEAGFKIREVPVVGIFHFKAGNERSFAFMQPNFVDINTIRALKGKAILTPDDLKFNDQAKAALNTSEADLFSESTVTSTAAPVKSNLDLNALLGSKNEKKADPASVNKGAWNYILIKLKPGVDQKAFIKKLNDELTEKKFPVKAQDWVTSANPDSGIFFAMSFILNVIIWLLAIVSIIIIMNTLVAAVMERTPEIGTMRALGAQKGFIRSLFIMETLVITAIFGVIGIVLGFLLILLLNWTGLSAPNDFMKLVFGGDSLRPDVTLNQIGVALSIIILIALVSWILPVRMALKVSPLKAINSD